GLIGKGRRQLAPEVEQNLVERRERQLPRRRLLIEEVRLPDVRWHDHLRISCQRLKDEDQLGGQVRHFDAQQPAERAVEKIGRVRIEQRHLHVSAAQRGVVGSGQGL